jgi:uncharacterized integral membrane protein (TIGR00697 family)
MSNEILWFLFMLADLSIALLAFRLFGKLGLYAVIVTSTIVCNIQVVETIKMFGMVATLGNVLYASIFFATDVISEVYGKKEARQGVWLGFFGLIAATIAMQFAIRFTPDASDVMHPHLGAIFSLMPRIAFASFTAYLLSQHHDIWAFHFWKRKTSGRYLWLRNNLSTMVSQLIDTTVFTFIAFWGVFPIDIFRQIFITTYFFKWIVAVVDTPFIYFARRMAKRCDLK